MVSAVRSARLRYHLTPSGGVWMHQQQGRNHVLLDPQARSRALSPGFVRPIELWGTRRWQRPPSAAVVRYHGDGDDDVQVRSNGSDPELDEPPATGSVVNRQSVVDFVGDVSAFRLGTLGLLIDAVASALDGGYPVVLAAPDAEQGALWIGAVSFFAPPMTCMRMSFSTNESLERVLADLEAENQRADAQLVESLSSVGHRSQIAASPYAGPGVRSRAERDADENSWRTAVLSVIPQADVEILTRRTDRPVILVDPRVESTIRAIGGADHRENQLGQTIPVTDWSRLALDASCEDFSALERCMQRLDEVSLSSPASGGPSGADWWPMDVDAAADLARSAGPAWPLAAAIALGGDLPLALPTATRVILRDTPAASRLHGELAATVSTLVSATVDDAEQAWRRMGSALAERPTRTALLQAAFESYLRLAMQDDDWLQRQAVPLPGQVPHDDGLALRLQAPAAALAGRLLEEGDDGRAGGLLLRAIELLHRLRGLVPGSVRPAVIDGLGRRAAELLLTDEGSRIAEVTGRVDAGALAAWVLPPMNRAASRWPRADRQPGLRLPPAVLGLLAGALDPGRIAALPSPQSLGADPVAAEVACAITCGRMAGDGRFRGPAVEYLLYLAVQAYPDADPQVLVDEVFGRVADGQPWRATPMLRMIQRAPARVAGHLVPVIFAHVGDWSEDADGARLAAALLKRVEFLPRMGGDGLIKPRRAGVADADIPVLNLLAATGPGWLTSDEGLYHRAAEILMWAERAWSHVPHPIHALIAPRITVAALQVALAAEPAQAGVVLRSRIPVVPIGDAWRSAVPLGLDRALPMMKTMLSLNNYRLTGELVCASTRAMVDPPVIEEQADLPRLSQLPVGPVVRWVVISDDSGRLPGHLAGLVEQELRDHDKRHAGDHGQVGLGPADRQEVLNFWRNALPDATVSDPAVIQQPEPAPEPTPVWDAMAVALGTGREAVATVVQTDLWHLLQARTPRVIEQGRTAIGAGSRPARRWWRRRKRR